MWTRCIPGWRKSAWQKQEAKSVARPDWLHLFERPFPSANMVLVKGEAPVLIDTGFGSDAAQTRALLFSAGVPAERLALIVNTHYHSDHVGGNYALQSRYGVSIAAHRWEAGAVNSRDKEACGAVWLRQPVEPYTVNRPLADGDEISAGEVTLRVLHTPGHTFGHISLFEEGSKTLICGDAVHSDDVAWLNFREGVGAVQRAMSTLERLLQLGARWACSGHGAPMTDPNTAIKTALARYERWTQEPERTAWHGMKRIFAYALMIEGGIREREVETYLCSSPWFRDYSAHVFEQEPADFITPLLKEMQRSKAAGWRADERGRRLVALAPHRVPGGWRPEHTTPHTWPKEVEHKK